MNLAHVIHTLLVVAILAPFVAGSLVFLAFVWGIATKGPR